MAEKRRQWRTGFIGLGLAAALATTAAAGVEAAPGDITVVAGLGLGDGGDVSSADVDASDAAYGPNGDVFFADRFGIRKVTTDGTISTVAGLSRVNTSVAADDSSLIVDGQTATSAQLRQQRGVTVDDDGTLYFADDIGWLYRVDVDGSIHALATIPQASFIRNGALPEVNGSGNVYVSDGVNDQVLRIDPNGVTTVVAGNGTEGFSGDGGAATDAQLHDPDGLAFDDAGALYIADSANRRVRRVDPDGTISTIAGTGNSGSSGNGGPATAARLQTPSDLSFAPDGRLLILDTGQRLIRSVDTNGIIRGVATVTQLERTVDVSPTGEVVITRIEVRRLSDDGSFELIAGPVTTSMGDGGPALDAGLNGVDALDFDSAGNTYALSAATIRRIDTAGVITTIAGSDVSETGGDGGPAVDATMLRPIALTVAPNDDILFVTEGYAGEEIVENRLRRIDADGIVDTVHVVQGFDIAEATGPTDVAVASDGTIYFATRSDVRTIDDQGVVSVVPGSEVPELISFGEPHIAIDASDVLYRVYPQGDVERFESDGSVTTVANVIQPHEIDVDSAGNLIVAGHVDGPRGPETFSLLRITPSGDITVLSDDALFDLSLFSASTIGLAVASDHSVHVGTLNAIWRIESSEPQVDGATITIVQETQPDSRVDFRYGGTLGVFRLDDPNTDDGDLNQRSRTFDVDAGTHRVRQQAFSAWTLDAINCESSTGTPVDDDVDLAKGLLLLDVADGEQITCTFENSRVATINARVGTDVDGDGRLDPGEPWTEGRPVELLDDTGALVASASTDEMGRTRFRVSAGSYQVCDVLPAGWTNTRPGDGAQTDRACIDVTISIGSTVWLRFFDQPPGGAD